MHRPGVELAISQSQVRRPNHYTTEPPWYIKQDQNEMRNDGLLCYRSSLDANMQDSVSMLDTDKEQAVDNVVLTKIEPLR